MIRPIQTRDGDILLPGGLFIFAALPSPLAHPDRRFPNPAARPLAASPRRAEFNKLVTLKSQLFNLRRCDGGGGGPVKKPPHFHHSGVRRRASAAEGGGGGGPGGAGGISKVARSLYPPPSDRSNRSTTRDKCTLLVRPLLVTVFLSAAESMSFFICSREIMTA